MTGARIAWEDPRDESVTSCWSPSVGEAIEEGKQLLEGGRIRHVWVRDSHDNVVWDVIEATAR